MAIKSVLHQERKYSFTLVTVLLICVISGFIPYLVDKHHSSLLLSVLMHLLSGIILSLLLIPYILHHIRRTLGFRRPVVVFSGLLCLPLILSFIYSGWHLFVIGQIESQSWVIKLHILSASLFLVLLVSHIAFHIISFPKKRKSKDSELLPSLPKYSFVLVISVNIIVFCSVVLIGYFYEKSIIPYSKEPKVQNYSYTYGSHPFRPSQTETVNNAFIDHRQIANSHKCLSCHQEIGNQWLSSIHRQAASDPAYVTNINLLENNKGIEATRYCEGCHAPVALLTGQLSPGGDHGGIKNTAANHEGVSCMSCHGIVSLPHLKGVASYTFKPAEDYIFANSKYLLLEKIHNLLIKVKPQQHKVDMGNPLLKDPKLCASCHAQFMDKDMNDWGWVKMQDEFSDWLNSPFSKKNNHNFSQTKPQTCNSCHMPLEKGNDPSSNENGFFKSHHFAAANSMAPMLNGDTQQMQRIINFMQSNKMRMTIEKPNRKNAVQDSLALDENIRDTEETPYYYYLGELANIRVIVSNIGVGHDYPGGTTDINQSWIEFLVVDAEGKKLFESGTLDEKHFVDPDAHFYESKPVDRFGKHVWRHDLFNMVGNAFERVIESGKSDIVDYQFKIPSWAKSPITISSVLKYRKFNQKYALWALNDQYRPLPIIDVAWDNLQIPVKIRKEVDSGEISTNNSNSR